MQIYNLKARYKQVAVGNTKIDLMELVSLCQAIRNTPTDYDVLFVIGIDKLIIQIVSDFIFKRVYANKMGRSKIFFKHNILNNFTILFSKYSLYAHISITHHFIRNISWVNPRKKGV